MDDFTSFPKFQYSEFFKNGRDGQMVIRSNNWEEFKELKVKLDEIMLKHQPVKPTQTVIPEAPQNPICGTHKVPMVWKQGVSRSTGKPYGFWGCSIKNEDGTWCNYKPDMIKKGI